MAKLLKLRRGTTSQHSSFTGAEGEVTVDTDKDVLVVNDGSTAGGHPLAAEDMANVSSASIAGRLSNDSIATSKIAAGALPSDVTVASANIVDGTIVNADVNASAAIAGTKISPDFGSQNISSTGYFTFGTAGGTDNHSLSNLRIENTYPTLFLNDTDTNNDFYIRNANGTLAIHDVQNSANRLTINSSGTVATGGNLDVGAGIDVTGAITSTGDITVTNASPKVQLVDSGNNPDWQIHNDDGTFRITDTTNSSTKLRIDGSSVLIPLNLDANGGLDVSGNITVTGTVDGRDVATDGTKLDGIESSATADQTAAEIRTLVESASDSNVFTDADHTKLNGIEASATADQTSTEIKTLLASDNLTNAHIANGSIGDAKLANNAVITARINNDAVTADKLFNVAQNHILGRIDSGTANVQTLSSTQIRTIINVEDGATADQSGSEIATALGAQNIYTTGSIGRDANDHIAFTDNSHMSINVNGNEEFRFEADGDFHADGDVIAYSTTVSSDENLKKDIVTVPDSLAKVEALKGVTFTWKKNDNKSAGVIAQDVQKVLPDAVRTVADFDGNDYLAVNYNALTSILIEAVKELSAKVKVLEAK